MDVEESMITFAELYYDSLSAGKTYTYYIREVKGDDASIEYSSVRYVVEVDVIDNGTRIFDFDVRYYKLGEDEPLGEEEIATFVNTKKYAFSVIKKAEDTGEALSGAVFVIKQGDLYVQSDGSLDEGAYFFTTGEDGTLKVEYLLPGDYVLIVKVAPEGYEKIDDVNFTISDADVELEIEDPKTPEERYSFTLIKKAKDSGKLLADAAFAIMQDGLYVQPDGSLSEDEYIFVTDEKGCFKVSNLLPGDYVLVEKKAPKGYETIDDVKFTISDADVELEIEDPKTPDKPHYDIPFTGIGG